MKKILLIFMSVLMTVSRFSCGNKTTESVNKTEEEKVVEEKVEEKKVDPKEEAKKKLAEAYDNCCPTEYKSQYAKLGYDKMALTIDTNPSDTKYNECQNNALIAIMATNVFLELPSSISDKMSSTRALDGMQTQNCGTYSVTWNYHPDNGLKVIYEVNP